MGQIATISVTADAALVGSVAHTLKPLNVKGTQAQWIEQDPAAMDRLVMVSLDVLAPSAQRKSYKIAVDIHQTKGEVDPVTKLFVTRGRAHYNSGGYTFPPTWSKDDRNDFINLCRKVESSTFVTAAAAESENVY